MPCEKLEKCPFFLKYKDELGATDYKLITEHYCEGHLMERCARLAYERSKGEKAPDNLSPTGVHLYGY